MKYVKNFHLLLFLICSTTFSQWVEQESGVDVTLRDVDFVDSLYGWCIGDSAIILHTSNGGSLWTKQELPIGNSEINRVEFIDRNSGYIVGRKGMVYSTKNGGADWSKKQIIESDIILNDLSFINADTGWVVGGNFLGERTRGVILKTTNGGENWTIQKETTSPSYFSSILFAAVNFFDENYGCAFGGDYFDNFSSSHIYITKNGGRDWEKTGSVFGLISRTTITAKDTIWAYGGSISVSKNGGIDWSPDSLLIGNKLDMAFFSSGEGLLIHAHITAGRQLQYTSNFGESWSIERINEAPGFGAIDNVGREFLWLVGASGRIVKYKPNITSIGEDEKHVPSELNLFQNYPNPFNSSTTINFELLNTNHISIIIYDILGKKIKTLTSRIYSPGYYSISWHGENGIGEAVKSGVYFYAFKVGNTTEIKKTILIR